ncbi:ABC transporter substrate-binding protein [Dongia deserti]|uniref:ABC transporter substrate-binding protein n=1 Tax=Dongia deserti TaxID=2268030 RepID=UPI000E6551B8|nr:ABC transporter substrate-binding protein [Dongia deserti]
MRSRRYRKCSAIIAAAVAVPALAIAATTKELEVMHLWTSGGEAAALQVLKDAVEKEGITWVDSAIAGDGGRTQQQALQARFAAGNPPASALAPGQLVLEYYAQDSLGDLTAVGTAENWDELIAPALQPFAKADGKWVAVPFNMHRENNAYYNKAILDENGGKVPETWDEFLAYLDKVKQGGKVIPLALGGDDWQETEIFSNILIGQAGVDFYKKAIMGLDKEALGSDHMIKALETFRKVLSYADANRPGRDWALATGMVMRGEAAVQFQGDWAVGDFTKADKKPGVDYVCASAPGNRSSFVFVTDFMAMFEQPTEETRANQEVLARLIMDRDVQEQFNIKKGSIPARLDVKPDHFNDCAKQAFADRDAAIKEGSLLPSLVESVAVPNDAKAAIIDVIHALANDASMSPQDAAAQFVENLEAL